MLPWLNLANLLTLVRLLLVPFVIETILAGRPVLALALFGAAAVTDILDGVAARRLNLGTQVGAYFDPIADKALLSGVFLALGASGTVPWWLVGVVLGRDLYILLAVVAFLVLTPVRKFPPSVWGKLSTFVQIVAVVVWMTGNWLQISWIYPLGLQISWVYALGAAMIWICAACTIWSGVHYTWRGIQVARTH